MKTISIRKKCLAVFLCTFLTVSIAACQKPSEEDESREAAGELYISYGSVEEERCVYKNMMWEKDGLSYTMMTSADRTLEEMAELAKAYIDSEK